MSRKILLLFLSVLLGAFCFLKRVKADSAPDELPPVKRNNPIRYGFIDPAFKFVIQPQYSAVGNFSEGLAWVTQPHTSRVGFVDVSNKLVIDFKYNSARDFHSGLASVSYNGKYGV